MTNRPFRLAVVAIGGNSLISETETVNVESEYRIVAQTCHQIADLIEAGWQVVITHGNGPQAGFNLRRCELATHELFELPLDVIVTLTQGSIGYYIQQNLYNIFKKRRSHKQVTTLVTQVEVDPKDPAFDSPTKPIGDYCDQKRADELRKLGWPVIKEGNRGWRRMVASPRPRRILEEPIIRDMLINGHVVITCGGGGVPVTADPEGTLRGVAAVVDKDFSSTLLANCLGAELLIISTAVDQVALNFGTPQQKMLNQLTIKAAEQYLEQGHFPAGNMGPKIQAAIEFIKKGGKEAIITSPSNILRSVTASAGTHIVRSNNT